MVKAGTGYAEQLTLAHNTQLWVVRHYQGFSFFSLNCADLLAKKSRFTFDCPICGYNSLGFEDIPYGIPYGGDADYNDLIVQVSIN